MSKFRIDLGGLKTGLNKTGLDTGLNYFVTFARKSGLKYDQQKHDNFVIVVINDASVTLVPFDWFNMNGNDQGYIWPAIAQLDLRKQKLRGNGMRMNYFEIDLELARDYT